MKAMMWSCSKCVVNLDIARHFFFVLFCFVLFCYFFFFWSEAKAWESILICKSRDQTPHNIYFFLCKTFLCEFADDAASKHKRCFEIKVIILDS